jgi:Domain of unknown function (DUF4157)
MSESGRREGAESSSARAHAAAPPVKAEARPSALQELQRRLGNTQVQRLIARQAGDGSDTEVDPTVESRIAGARGGGKALEGGVQSSMEAAFGVDFSGVRVHTDSGASSLSRSVEAVAFTTGQDIFFSEGAYDPGSSAGRHLLAHELTHVVQQTGPDPSAVQRRCSGCSDEMEQMPIQPKLRVSQPRNSDEVEADRAANQVTAALDSTAAGGESAAEEP